MTDKEAQELFTRVVVALELIAKSFEQYVAQDKDRLQRGR